MKKRPNRWLIFSGLAFQIALVMFVFIEFGQWLDAQQETKHNTYSLIAGCLAMICILYLISKQTKNLK